MSQMINPGKGACETAGNMDVMAGACCIDRFDLFVNDLRRQINIEHIRCNLGTFQPKFITDNPDPFIMLGISIDSKAGIDSKCKLGRGFYQSSFEPDLH